MSDKAPERLYVRADCDPEEGWYFAHETPTVMGDDSWEAYVRADVAEEWRQKAETAETEARLWKEDAGLRADNTAYWMKRSEAAERGRDELHRKAEHYLAAAQETERELQRILGAAADEVAAAAAMRVVAERDELRGRVARLEDVERGYERLVKSVYEALGHQTEAFELRDVVAEVRDIVEARRRIAETEKERDDARRRLHELQQAVESNNASHEAYIEALVAKRTVSLLVRADAAERVRDELCESLAVAELKAENRGIIIGKQERRIQDLRERLAAAEKEARQRAEAAEKERDELKAELGKYFRAMSYWENRGGRAIEERAIAAEKERDELRAKLHQLELEIEDQRFENMERDR